MVQIWFLSLFSVFMVSLISLIGIITLPIGEKRLKNILLYFVSFSAGALLGDVFIHLLPEAVEKNGFTLHISTYILVGILASFILEKLIHSHHVHLIAKKQSYHPVSIMSLIGDSVHNFIDGLIIAASYLVSTPVGVATTVAVILHEIPQEMGNFGILIHGGFSRKNAFLFNFLTALTAFLGVFASLLWPSSAQTVPSFLIPFAAGNFIYIAASDLIPELNKEVGLRKGLFQTLTFMLGVFVMVLLLLVG